MSEELWERQEWDTDLAYHVFQIWMKLPFPRSLDEAWRQYKKMEYTESGARVRAPDYVKQMYAGAMDTQLSGQYPRVSWEERVRSKDLDEKRRDLILWTERQRTVKVDEWEMSRLLLQKAREMLEWPIYDEEVKQEEDGTYIIRQPARWNMRDIQAIAKVASELSRLATDMNQGKFAIEFSLNLSSEALQAVDILKQHGVQYSDVVQEFEQILIQASKRVKAGG